MAVVCLLARGHVLIEDVPGVGKTTLARPGALGGLRRGSSSRGICCRRTSSACRSSARTGAFEFAGADLRQLRGRRRDQPGDAAHAVRAPRGDERALGLGRGQAHALPEPFMVVATKIRRISGARSLPESQFDRFMMRLNIGYPPRPRGAGAAGSREVWRGCSRGPRAVLTREELLSSAAAGEGGEGGRQAGRLHAGAGRRHPPRRRPPARGVDPRRRRASTGPPRRSP